MCRWLGTDGRVRPSLRKLLRFDDFAAAQAGRAHAHVLGGCADLCVNRAQIDVPAPFGYVVRVADGVAELRPLAANITNSCHD